MLLAEVAMVPRLEDWGGWGWTRGGGERGSLESHLRGGEAGGLIWAGSWGVEERRGCEGCGEVGLEWVGGGRLGGGGEAGSLGSHLLGGETAGLIWAVSWYAEEQRGCSGCE